MVMCDCGDPTWLAWPCGEWSGKYKVRLRRGLPDCAAYVGDDLSRLNCRQMGPQMSGQPEMTQQARRAAGACYLSYCVSVRKFNAFSEAIRLST